MADSPASKDGPRTPPRRGSATRVWPIYLKLLIFVVSALTIARIVQTSSGLMPR